MTKIAVIGGSGVYGLDQFKIKEKIKVKTPFGDPSEDVSLMEVNGTSFYFIARHGEGHTLSPSDINYRANIFALKKLGVEYIISVSAVGSLKEEFAPGHFVFISQFIDWTKGLRERSFFSHGLVGHVSTAEPVERALRDRLYEVAQKENVGSTLGGTYICIEGPQFSTKAESNLYRSFNCDVIGMTNVPESFLAKEAGIAYATIAMVTDYDGWKEEHCSLEEVMNTMKQNYQSVQKVLTSAISSLERDPISFTPENKNSVLTNSKFRTPQHEEVLKVILNE